MSPPLSPKEGDQFTMRDIPNPESHFKPDDEFEILGKLEPSGSGKAGEMKIDTDFASSPNQDPIRSTDDLGIIGRTAGSCEGGIWSGAGTWSGSRSPRLGFASGGDSPISPTTGLGGSTSLLSGSSTDLGGSTSPLGSSTTHLGGSASEGPSEME